MSLDLVPTTELEAVNQILASVGESPIADFDESAVDAELARQMLHQEMRRVQSHGWSFNTETEYPLTPDNSGTIHIAPDVMKIVPQVDEKKYVVRGARLYNRETRSFVFTDAVTLKSIVFFLPFEDIPEPLRAFCISRASRRFQARLNGDKFLEQSYTRDELAAWAAFLEAETETEEYNFLSGSALIARMKGNR